MPLKNVDPHSIFAGILIIFIVAIAVVLLFLPGCAAAVQVDLTSTMPVWNSTPTCTVAAGDSLTDLSQLYVYAQKSGAADSVLVGIFDVAGMEGKDVPISFNHPEGTWKFWEVVADATKNFSCRSNVVTRLLVASPGAPTIK